MSLLQIYQWVCQWKNFENRLTFGEVMGKSLVSCFFLRHSVYDHMIMSVGLFGHSTVVFRVFNVFSCFYVLLTVCVVVFFQWLYIDLFSCIAASLFDQLTWSTCASRHLQLRTGGFCWCKVADLADSNQRIRIGERRRWSSPQQCYLRCLCAATAHHYRKPTFS